MTKRHWQLLAEVIAVVGLAIVLFVVLHQIS